MNHPFSIADRAWAAAMRIDLGAPTAEPEVRHVTHRITCEARDEDGRAVVVMSREIFLRLLDANASLSSEVKLCEEQIQQWTIAFNGALRQRDWWYRRSQRFGVALWVAAAGLVGMGVWLWRQA